MLLSKSAVLKKPQKQMQGFSIVELMVAILIGLIVLAGVVQVVLTSRTTFLSQEEISYIQENSRYAMDVMSKDIQSAGYWGCAGFSPKVAAAAKPFTADSNADVLLGKHPLTEYFISTQPITGFVTGFPTGTGYSVRTINAQSGVDTPESFVVRGAEGEVHSLQSHVERTLTLVDEHDFSANDYAVVIAEDCRRIGIIKASAVTNNTLSYAATSVCGSRVKPGKTERFYCDVDCNCSQQSSLLEVYLPGSTVMDYVAHGYYIGNSSVLPGQPALKRIYLSSTGSKQEEIALGVEDLQVRYGVDSNDDGKVDGYVAASSIDNANWDAWHSVKSVEVSLLFRSQSPSAAQAEVHTYLGNTYNDRYLRQLVTSVIRLRNRT